MKTTGSWRTALVAAAAAALCGLACFPVRAQDAAAKATTPAPAVPGDRAFVDQASQQVDEALWWGDEDALEALHARCRATTATSSEGATAMDRFRNGLYKNMRKDYGEGYLNEMVRLSEAWSVHHPASPVGPLVEARALMARAWYHRGGGYADTVAPAQWQAFFQDLDRAAGVLASHAQVLAGDSTMHLYLVMIGRDRQWPRERIVAIARDGLAHAPGDLDIWEELVVTALPKWGGSWQEVDRLVRQAAASMPDAEQGDYAYMRLYRVVHGELAGGFLGHSLVDWARMQRGFRVAMARGTATLYTSEYARIACDVQDRPLARELTDRLGDAPDLYEFGGGDEGKARYERCRRWAHAPADADADADAAGDGAPAPAVRTPAGGA